MLEKLMQIHREVMSTCSVQIKRYLYHKIRWDAHALCILGDRGVGKTTLMCQRFLEEYKSVEKALYISADNVTVAGLGLFNIAQEYISNGGEALFIDEVHKYPNWSIEIKNIIDTYKKCQVIFSASSSLDLNQSKADLSRRVVYHRLLGLSFREFLLLSENIALPPLSLEDILQRHVPIAEELTSSVKILKAFKNYISHGYYPFFLEGIQDYLSKMNNVIEKVIFEDIAVVFNLKQTTLPILKKILWLVATTPGLTPNIDRIGTNLGVSREVIYNCLEYLHQSGLLSNLYHQSDGLKLVRKPGKIYLNNTNLLFAINDSIKRESSFGGVRETFFVNQVASNHSVSLHGTADFLIDEMFSIEVGGRNKDFQQLKNLDNAYLAVDDIEIGFRNKIPLYLFGFLY